jgi:hypothetical protein
VCEEEKMLNNESFYLMISHLILKGSLSEGTQGRGGGNKISTLTEAK